jgi:hypothetical protein
MAKGDMQNLSPSQATDVGFGAGGKAELAKMFPGIDPATWDRLKVTYPANSAIDRSGTPATQAAVIPVPPDRLLAPLPPGQNPKLVISIQAPGATQFDTPAPATFPNLDGLPPGAQSLVWSFNHDAGRWDVIGTGTVSADGKTITTDPGVGIRAPGWHFVEPGTDATTCDLNDPNHLDPVPNFTLPNDQFYTDDSGSFHMDFRNDAEPPESGSATCNLVVKIEVDGPAEEFLSGLESGTKTFTLGPGEDKTIDVQEVPLLAEIKALTADQLYAVHVHVTAYRDDDPGNLLKDETFNVARYEAVVDPNAPSLNALFLKTLANGTFTRTKEFDYHLPEHVPTTFTAGGGDAGLFNFGGPVQDEDTALWTFRPAVAGKFSTQVLIAIGGKALPQALTARGTGVAPTKIGALGVRGQDYAIALETYLTNPHHFDNTANVSQASAAFRAAFQGVLPDDHPTAQQLGDAVSAAAAALSGAVAEDYGKVDPGGKAFLFGDTGNDVAIEWQQGLVQCRPGGPLADGCGSVDRDTETLKTLLPKATLPEAAREYVFAEFLNPTATGDRITLTLEQEAHTFAGGTSWEDFLSHMVSHELAHTFGQVESYLFRKNGAGEVTGARNLGQAEDIMWAINGHEGHLDFSRDSVATLQAAMGVAPDNVGALARAIRTYLDHFSLPDTRGVAPIISAEDQPSLGINGPGGDLVSDDTVDLGAVAADGPGGQMRSIPVTLTDIGTLPLTINQAALGGAASGFTLAGGVTPGTSIDPGKSVTLNVVFDPQMTGPASDTLTITTSAADSPFTLSFTGSGLAAAAHVSVTLQTDPDTGLPQNNLGGLQVGAPPLTVHHFATVTNTGGAPLTVSNVVVGDGPYTVGGLPAGFGPGSPLVLQPGQSFPFDLTFAASKPGLLHGEVQILSNDPATPVFRKAVLGTGLVTTGFLNYPNAYAVIDTGSGVPLRARVSSAQTLQFVLPPRTPYQLTVFDPASGLVAHSQGVTAATGKPTDLGVPFFQASTAPDNDGDGLPNDAEFAIGTNPDRFSTTGDGIGDGAKVAMGLDPLDGRGFPTGIIASLPLQGEAQKVVLAGSPLNAQHQTAYVATGSCGLAVVDASQFNNPIVLGQLPLSGFNSDLAVDPADSLVAVAAGTAGLHVVDVSDPMTPLLRQTVPLHADHVKVADSFAYVASGSVLTLVDPLTGDVLDQHAYDGGTIDDMAVADGFLYTVAHSGTEPHTVSKIALGDTLAPPVATLTVTGHPTFGRMHVFAGGGLVYVGAADNNDANQVPGVEVIQDTGPALQLVGPPSPITAFDVAANGSGLAVYTGLSTVGLLDVSDPTKTGQFLTSFATPGPASSVAIASGIAYATSGTGGLQVINYLSFDSKGVPPTVSISTPAGSQVVEGSAIPVRAAVADDVQVRNVELLVNGRVVSNAVSFPFNLSAVAPTFSAAAHTVTLQVRATDTGGNSSLSNVQTLDVVPDTTPPAILSIDPPNGSLHAVGLRAVRVRFSKSLDASTVNAQNFRLLDGNANVVTPLRVDARHNGQFVQLTFDALGAGNYQLVIKAAAVTDGAGHPLGTADVVSTFKVAKATASIVWKNATGRFWDDPTNWDTGVVPGPSDDVFIPALTSGTVEHRQDDTTIRSLRSDGAFTLSGGSLTVTAASQVGGAFTFGGNATLLAQGQGASFQVTGPATLGTGTLEALAGGTLDFPTLTSYSGGSKADTFVSASGAGSHIGLEGLTALTGGQGRSVFLGATQGGTIDLSKVPQLTGGGLSFQADGAGSAIDLSALTSWSRNPATDFGFAELTARNGGTLHIDKLTSLDAVGLTVGAGAVVPVAQITRVSDGGSVSAEGATVVLSGLTAIDASSLSASKGGVLSLPAATSYALGTQPFVARFGFTAQDAGSRIDLSGLTSLSGGGGAFLEIKALGGGVIDLSRVPRITGEGVTVSAQDAGSLVDLSALASMSGAGPLSGNFGPANLQATAGGELRVPKLTTLDTVNLTVSTGATVPVAQITSYTHGTVAAEGTTLTLGGLSNIDTLNFQNSQDLAVLGQPGAHPGGVVNLPAVTGYGGAGSFRSTDPGSLINLSGVTSLSNLGNLASFTADNGGTIDLSKVAQITAKGSPTVRTLKSGSLIDLSALTSWSGGGDVDVSNGGTVRLSAGTTTLSGVEVFLSPSGTLTAGTLDLEGGTLTGNGTLNGNLINGGTILLAVSGGSSNLVLTVGGNYTQTAAGTLTLGIGGLTPGKDFAQVKVTGSAQLDGALELTSGYTPKQGDAFQVLTYASHTGQFATLTKSGFGGSVVFTPGYNATDLTLTVTQV